MVDLAARRKKWEELRKKNNTLRERIVMGFATMEETLELSREFLRAHQEEKAEDSRIIH